MTLLLEELGNLNRIDKSLLLFNDGSTRGNHSIMYLGATGITEKSRVEVNKITPHNFTTLMGMLDEDRSIGAIVVRAHGRQLCLVTKLHLYSTSNYLYFLKFSEYAMQKIRMSDYYNWNGFLKNDRMAPIKTAISRCVKGFYDNIAPEGTKKKWDAVIIYKDETVDTTRINRAESQKGMVKNPGEKGYDEFEKNLRDDFERRCKEYLDKARINTTNKEEIAQYIMNRAKINKFKFNNYTYELDDMDSSAPGSSYDVKATYLRQQFESGSDLNIAPRKLRLIFSWKGYVPYLSRIVYSNSAYRYSSSGDWKPLEELPQTQPQSED